MSDTVEAANPVASVLWGEPTGEPERLPEAVGDGVSALVRAALAHGPVDVQIRRGPGLAASTRVTVRDQGPGYDPSALVPLAGRLIAFSRAEEDGEKAPDGDDPDGLLAAWKICRSLELVTRRARDRTGTRWVHRGHDTCEFTTVPTEHIGTTLTLTLADAYTDIEERHLRPVLEALCHDAPHPVTLNARPVSG